MVNTVVSQDNFTKGELSPLLYARTTVTGYYLGVKQAFNTITYPQGALGKRFGTYFRSKALNITSSNDVFFLAYQYGSECCYQVLVRSDNIDIYLEGQLVATIASTGMDTNQVQNMDYTVIEHRLIITAPAMKPANVIRAASTGNVITGYTSSTLTVTNAMTVGLILPFQITTGGALPVTVPQIVLNKTYFLKVISSHAVSIYANSHDAAYDYPSTPTHFTISSAGTGTNTIVPYNTFTFPSISFRNLPVYDFTGGYDALTFTPSATFGTVTLVASGAIYTAAHVGGAFVGGGGSGRITAVADSTHATVSLDQSFTGDLNIPPAAVAISGRVSLLAEPAWSDTRGWPILASSYQNRALFSNSASLPNGFWASAINSYNDFNDIQRDDDDAISWYPSSDNITYIRYIVPYRSITIHANSGVFSSPLGIDTAITPTNFSLNIQDSTPATVLEPVSIDNQIIIISGNDVHTLLWDGINNAYTSSIISILSEHLILSPVDEFTYNDQQRAGSRYVFVINGNGSLAIYQTLISESISGWIPAGLEQSYGSAYFRQGISSLDGYAWFLTERQIAVAASAVLVTAVTAKTTSPDVASYMTAAGTSFDTAKPTAVKFTASGAFPSGDPVLVADTYYWVIGIDADNFNVYLDQADALAAVNAINFTALNSTTHVVPWPLQNQFFIEELTFDTRLDCAVIYDGTPTDTITSVPMFDAQNIKMNGDGFGFDAQGNDDEILFAAHGDTVEVSRAFAGFPINTIIEPLPVSIPKGDQTTLTRPNHIRNVNFIFNQTIGGSINGVPIALDTFLQNIPGNPPVPSKGIFSLSVMKAWDDYNNPSFVLTHSDPFELQLLGVFYTIDIYR